MARKPPKKAITGTIITRIGVLSGGEVVALESVGSDLFLTINGQKIVRRKPMGKGTKTWIPVKQGWMVLDTNGPFSLQISRDGKLLDWSSLKDVNP
jgi:hypothetical protein